MRKKPTAFFRNNGLSLTYLGLFLICLVLQSLTGWQAFNKERQDHREAPLTYRGYVGNAHFWQAVGENWESEFLQMGSYVLFTVFLFQKGSSESKDPEKEEEVDQEPQPGHVPEDAPWPVQRRGWVLGAYRYSLTAAFLVLFLLSFALHAVAGSRKEAAEAASHGQTAESLGEYMISADFWFESMQNWQSEFLAVFSMVTLSIFLRQKGSPESKPLAAAHSETGK